MAHEKSDEPYKPEEFTINILLPRIVIEELRDMAKFHDTTVREEITRAVLKWHAQGVAEMIEDKIYKDR